MLRLRRLRSCYKNMIIVQRLSVTIATHSAKPTVNQGMHSDKDHISKLCPSRIVVRSNYSSACEKRKYVFLLYGSVYGLQVM